MSIDFYQALGTILATALVLLGQRGWVLLNRHVGAKTAVALTTLAPIAVQAAEELAHQGANSGGHVTGEEKLDFAKARLTDLAKLGHIKLTDETTDAIIHGALNELRPYMAPLEEPIPNPPAQMSNAIYPRPVKDNPQA